MDTQHIESIDDPRIAAYRDLTDRQLHRTDERFVAEGAYCVERLLHSDYDVESLLIVERWVERMAPHVPHDVPIYVADEAMVCDVVGYKFHRGGMACGRRRKWPTVEQVMGDTSGALTLLILPEIHNAENLGALIRIGASFGVDAIVLGPRCCDPLYRRTIRVAMGAMFHLPIAQSQDMAGDLQRLREQWGVQLAATVIDADAEPLAHALRPARLGLLLGSESQGLAARWVRACDRKLTIPMQLGVDSLNVAIAAAVCLYHFTHVAESGA